MNVILPRHEFLDALHAAASLASSRTTKPILACTKFATKGERVELSATDGEAALRLGVQAVTIKQQGEAVVPADRLLSIVREMSDVEISLEVDDRHCTIRGEGSNFRIFVMNASDFPPVPDFEGDPDLVIEAAELRRMVDLTLYAAARETSRYAINGVLWEKQGKKLFLIATDGRRLARSGGSLEKVGSGDFKFIVPTKALSVFEKVFAHVGGADAGHIDLKVLPNQVLLRCGERVLSTVLLEGHFPDYNKVIPESNDKRASVQRDELFGAVRRAALLTTEESRAVRLTFADNRLVITSQSPEQGDARVEIPVNYDGESVEIGFNPAFINDALKVIPFDQVFVEMHNSFRPGVLCGEDKGEFLYVVMPVQLSGS